MNPKQSLLSFSILFILAFPRFLYAQSQVVLIPKSEDNQNTEAVDLFVVVEEMPEFRYNNFNSTEESFKNYIEENIEPPSRKCSGKAYIQFIIFPDGTANKLKILKGPKNCDGFEDELLRLIKDMPKWTPGKQKGNLVYVLKTMEVDFKSK